MAEHYGGTCWAYPSVTRVYLDYQNLGNIKVRRQGAVWDLGPHSVEVS